MILLDFVAELDAELNIRSQGRGKGSTFVVRFKTPWPQNRRRGKEPIPYQISKAGHTN